MASIDGMRFASPQDASSGAAFLLATPSPKSAVLALAGLHIEVAEKSRYVLARGVTAPSYSAVRRAALVGVQQGLDYLSARGQADLQTVDTPDHHLVWWHEHTGPVARICSTSVLKPRLTATLHLTDAAGRVVPPAAPPPATWHQSMRFWRQAQLADDVFDALRSLWLGVENLLDELSPFQAGEHEGNWVKRAFRQAEQHVSLGAYLPVSAKAAHNAAHDYFYDELRKSLFHAKASKNPLLPQDPYARLRERHERLSRLYVELLRVVVGVSRGGGGLSYAAFADMASTYGSGATLYFSDDNASWSPADEVINPTGGAVESGARHPEPALSTPDKYVLLGYVAGHAAGQLPRLRRAGLGNASGIHAVELIDGELEVTGLCRLEGQQALRLENAQEPRSFLDY